MMRVSGVSVAPAGTAYTFASRKTVASGGIVPSRCRLPSSASSFGSRFSAPTSLLPAKHAPNRSRQRLVVSAGGPAGGMKGGGGGGEEVNTPGRVLLVGLGVSYVVVALVLPFLNIFFQAFNKGVGPFLTHLVDPEFLHAIKLTLMLAAIAVPINTMFGVAAAIQLTRNEFPGKALVLTLLDLPFSISPVVTGLMLTLLYGRKGVFYPLLDSMGLQVVFAFPGMLLATMFVTFPFVARELIPVLETQGTSEEEAARTLGASEWEVFWDVTLPNIRWGLLYGMILTNARAMGEFGAVAVISGNIIGQTQTATLYVEAAYKEYNTEAAFSAAVVLSLLAMGTIFIKDRLESVAAKEIEK